VDPKVVGNPLAAVLTPKLVGRTLGAPPKMQAALEDSNIQTSDPDDMEVDQNKAGEAMLRSWGVNPDPTPKYIT
jgi:hypothetical protein